MMKRLALTLILPFLFATQVSAETVLITGSNKGIGLAFTKAYLERGATVIATARKPNKAEDLKALKDQYGDQLKIEQLDVTNDKHIEKLAEKYKDTPIDLLLNNAGISGLMKQEAFGQIDYDHVQYEFEVNTFGPIKMAEAFIDNVAASDQKKIVAVSSSMGSIETAKGFMYGYRMSKAALNMAYKGLSTSVKGKGIAVGLVNPGPTRTDLMKEVPGDLRSPDDAAADMIRNIDGLTVETTGAFMQYDGTTLPW